MGLFSFSRKNQQQQSSGNSDFYSQADEETSVSRKRRQGKKREEAVDPLLPQKKRARRRLIGAVALVLAVIIGLPMLLDPEPKPLSDDIAIQIPSKDSASTRTQSLANVAPKSDSAVASAALDANEQIVDDASTSTSTTKPEQTLQSVAQPSQATPAVNPAELKKPIEAQSTEVAANAAAEAKATAEAEKKADDAARARAILTGKAPPATVSKTLGKVVVQVAALSTQEKVDELQKKLKDAGLKSYTEKVNTASGIWTRVRIGPFANDAEAESVRAKLIKIGLNGKLLPI